MHRRGSLDNEPRPLKMSSTGPVGLVSRILFPRVLTRSAASGRTELRQRLVVLGCGWGSYSLLRSVNKKKFDVICISPRNHFLFTPLLASTTVGKKEFSIFLISLPPPLLSGTLEFRSIVEPIRNTGFRDEHHFHLSYATHLDHEKKIVQCRSALDPSMTYPVSYDTLVIGVGANSSTFNIPGVNEHAFFLKVVRERLLYISICAYKWKAFLYLSVFLQ